MKRKIGIAVFSVGMIMSNVAYLAAQIVRDPGSCPGSTSCSQLSDCDETKCNLCQFSPFGAFCAHT